MIYPSGYIPSCVHELPTERAALASAQEENVCPLALPHELYQRSAKEYSPAPKESKEARIRIIFFIELY